MNKKRVLVTIAVIAVLALLAYLQFRTWRSFDWKVFWQQTRSANPVRLLAGLALIYATYLLRAMRWTVMLRPSKHVPARELLGTMVIGFTGVAILGRPGDLIRPYIISRKHDLTFSSQVAVLAVERVFDIGCFALLLVIDVLFAANLRGLPYFHQFYEAGVLLCVLVAGLAGGLFLIWRSGDAVGEWMNRLLGKSFPRAARALRDKIKTFGEGLHTVRDLGSFLQIFGLSIAIWLLIAFAYVQVTHAYPAPLHRMELSHVLLLMSASIAGSLLQLPMVGGGSQLATIGVMKAVFDVAPELAVSCGIMLWLVTFMAIVPIGLGWARIEHVDLIKVEEEAEEQELSTTE